MLGVTYKTAWFIFHRVREAMRHPAFTSQLSGTVRPRKRNGKLSIPLPFDEAVKAALDVPPPKRVERAKKTRVASRPKRKKS